MIAVRSGIQPGNRALHAEHRGLVQQKMLIKNALGLGIYLPAYGFDANYSKMARSSLYPLMAYQAWPSAIPPSLDGTRELAST